MIMIREYIASLKAHSLNSFSFCSAARVSLDAVIDELLLLRGDVVITHFARRNPDTQVDFGCLNLLKLESGLDRQVLADT